MVYLCHVPGCRTGYKPKKGESFQTNEKIALFQFPKKQNLKEKWIIAIPKQNSQITSNFKVCGLHFEPDDFVAVSTDEKTNR